MDDRYWMSLAYAQALQAESAGEVPVGAVIIGSDNDYLSAGFNQVIARHDPSAHAEMIAIRAASEVLKNHRLSNATLYVTLEPCAMCAGAIVQARLGRIVFATRDLKTGAAGSVYNLLQGYPLNHAVQIDEGIMEEACSKILKDFFRARRVF